jgi:hypothetical protein
MSTDTSQHPAERAGPCRASFAGHLILACFIAAMLVSTLHKTAFSTTPRADHTVARVTDSSRSASHASNAATDIGRPNRKP